VAYILLLNSAFSVRKCVVKPGGKIMIASYGEISGFSVVNTDELMLINGGKGSGGGGGGGSSVTSAGFTTAKTPTNQVTASFNPENPSVTVKMGNTSVKAEASISYSLTSKPPVTVKSATVSVTFKR
jgi:hypothetical protein